MVKYVSTYTKGTLKEKKKRIFVRDFSNDANSMFLFFSSSDFLDESLCCRYPFKLHRLVDKSTSRCNLNGYQQYVPL